MRVSKNVSRFAFIEHWIKNFSVKNTAVSIDGDSVVSRNIDLDYNITDVAMRDDEVKGFVDLDISVVVKSKVSQGEPDSMTVKMTICGLFVAPSDYGENEFRRLLEINGTAVLYSIARASLISITSQCIPFGMIRIPMLDVHSFVKSRAEQKKKKAKRRSPATKGELRA